MITKERPILHYASDRRCYNGACCTDLQREIDSRESIKAEIMKAEPNFRTCYFPGTTPHGYTGWIGLEQITDFHDDVGDALLEAWDKIIGSKL